jgi:hypothetical protein
MIGYDILQWSIFDCVKEWPWRPKCIAGDCTSELKSNKRIFFVKIGKNLLRNMLGKSFCVTCVILLVTQNETFSN